MSARALLLELLVSGFFAIACFKARATSGQAAMRPRDFLRLTDRLDRLSRTRWQWFSMVAIIILVRIQAGVPLAVELTAAVQFIVFLALPVARQEKQRHQPERTPSSRSQRIGVGLHRRTAAPATRPQLG